MLKKLILAGFICSALAACGPYTSTTTSYINTYITSDPSGAMVIYGGKTIGTTPCIVNMPVKTTITAAGGTLKNMNYTTSVTPWEITFVKDGITESASYAPNALPVENGKANVDYTFSQAAYMKDPTIMAGEADNMVSRDAPGQTALERTVLRWYFDSDPRGARIYWRVISSIPHIVKNTNEAYLMTTPFEETRSFNILGLTYENSRDVQIEIKASKRGYEDQVKRYNVRQAIDQQEISGFFELVPKPEEE